MNDKVKQIRVKNITVDQGIQSRDEGLAEPHVADIFEAIGRKKVLPPLVLFQNAAGTLLLADGFHRLEAYTRAGWKDVPCVVRKGERTDAIDYAASEDANGGHGLKRTNATKRKCVLNVLANHADWSNRRISEHVGVSDEFVRKVRPTVPGADTTKREGKDGKTYSAPPAQVPTVGTSTVEIPEENAVSTPETASEVEPEAVVEPTPEPPAEPEPVDPADEEPAVPFAPPAAPKTPVVKDGLGAVVPRGLADTFADPMLADAIARIDAAHKELVSISQHVLRTLSRKGEFWPFALFGECAKSLDAAADRAAEASAQLFAGVPFCVCPKCRGDGCADCRNSGAWPRHRHDNRAQYGDAA